MHFYLAGDFFLDEVRRKRKRYQKILTKCVGNSTAYTSCKNNIDILKEEEKNILKNLKRMDKERG